MRHYKWDKATGEVTPCEDVLEAARWASEAGSRTVARDEVGDYVVYTSFLMIDHEFGNMHHGEPELPPLLFETMCTLRGEWCDLQIRYSTSADAQNCHQALVEHLRAGGTPESFEGGPR